MITRIAIVVFAVIAGAPVAHAETRCTPASEVETWTKLNDLKEHGSMEIDSQTSEIAYVNSQKHKYLTVKKRGRCFFDMKFMSQNQYEEHFQFEGENEDDTETDGGIASLFSEYSARREYNGKSKTPDFKGRDKAFASFRTRITDGMNGRPTFAGEYSIIQFGCGTSCSVILVANHRTGQVYDFPFSGAEYGPVTLRYAPVSSLLMLTRRDGANCVMEAMTSDAGIWKRIATTPVGSADACYDGFDENFARYQKAIGREVAKAAKTETMKPAERRQADKSAPLISIDAFGRGHR